MKWQRHGNKIDLIATIHCNDLSVFKDQTNNIFQNDKVPYSGIIMSSNNELIQGENIENSCYNKGGFVFLYKNYTTYYNKKFAVEELLSTIIKLGKLYLKEIDLEYNEISIDSCWAVCQREGDYGTLHNHISPKKHNGKFFSGMIYLQIPESINGKTFPDGCLHLIGIDNIIYIPPVANTINIWPGEIIHGIHPFKGSGDRTGIAFNFIVL